ncbi:MAG: hypothetical protein ACO1OQ_09110, partial [Rufibacter sp.]
MEAPYLLFAQIGFGSLTVLCLALVLAGIYHTFLKLGFARKKAGKRTTFIGLLLIGWLAVVSMMALSGFMGNFSLAPLNMLPALLPPLVAVIILTFHSRTQNFIHHLPAKGLLHLQVFRIPVEVFLWWLFLAQALPERMTFEGTNWDILSGFAGPVVALLCFGGGRSYPKGAMVYNLVGLVLLLNIVATGILSLPTPFQKFFEAPGATVMTTFPVMLLPAFLVSLAYT